MISLRVRPATERDTDAVTKIMRTAFDASYTQFMPDECIREWSDADSFRSTVLAGLERGVVAEVDGETKGFLVTKDDCIEELWVAPGSQGLGIGKALMAWAEEHIRKAGISASYLHCYEANTIAQKFYEKLGYKQSARFMSTEVPGGPIPVLTFSKILK